MISRQLEQNLIAWKQNAARSPLIVRGARQVGKSFLIETFGKAYFNNLVTINFELNPEYKACFNELDPQSICNAIATISQQPIHPGETLLFLDEIQDCPQAIQSLRYFKEKLPDLHLIGAGSLLELALKTADYRMPVGRVSFLNLYPVSFNEFLRSYNPEALQYVESATLKNPPPEAIHQHLLKQLKLYFLLGGMPAVIADYQEKQDIQSIQALQSNVLETYRQDFGHYHKLSQPNLLRTCFEKIPLMVGQQIKYNKIDPESRSRELKQAIATLEATSLLHRITASSAQGLPLDHNANEKKFKLNFIDIGLVKRINQLDAELLLDDQFQLLNSGALAEQFVGQELLCYAPAYEKAKLYFWARDGSSNAEVDYLFVAGKQIIPIEVKAGKSGKLRSLQQFLLKHPSDIGVRLSSLPLGMERNVLSVPLYMISELERLLR